MVLKKHLESKTQWSLFWLPSNEEDTDKAFLLSSTTSHGLAFFHNLPWVLLSFNKCLVSVRLSHMTRFWPVRHWTVGASSFDPRLWLHVDMSRKARTVCKHVVLWEESASAHRFCVSDMQKTTWQKKSLGPFMVGKKQHYLSNLYWRMALINRLFPQQSFNTILDTPLPSKDI